MIYYTFLFLTISSTIVSSGKINGLDDNVFHQIQEVHKGTGSKERIFVKTIWSELRNFLPDSARIPGVELPFRASTDAELESTDLEGKTKGQYWYNNFICAFESKIYPKLAEFVSAKAVVQDEHSTIHAEEGRVVVEVNGKFSMDERSMDYNLYQKVGGSNDATGPVPVSYKFNDKSKLDLILDIPDFSTISTISDASCLVNIRSVKITELSSPTSLNNLDTSEEEIADKYWDTFAVKSPDMKTVMSIGIRRAINRKLKGMGTFWICLSEEFKSQLEKDENQYNYSVIYNQYCKNSVIED